MKHLKIFGLLLLAAWVGLFAPAQAQFGGPSPVVTDQARMVAIAPTIQVAGTVISRSDAVLSSEVEGRLMQIAEVGTRVEAGDVMAQIEDTVVLLREQELQAEITRVEARLRFLEAELDRFTRLAENNLAARTQIDQTRSDRDISASELNIARSRLAQVQAQLDRTRIQAPFSGVVVERLMQAGERVSIGSDVLRLVDPDHLEVVARAPLNYYRYVRPGDELAIRVDDDLLIPAPLRTVVSIGNEFNHVFELRLDVEQPLPVGQTVRVTVPTADVREVLAVPRDALVLRGDGISIFIVDDDNKARRISVATGIGSDDLIEVTGPIQAGDRVVVRGNERLRPGQDVAIQES